MRLSDIKGDSVFEVIADIIDPAYNIASDKGAARLFRRESVPKGMTSEEFVLKKIHECVPQLMRSHKDDLVKILSTIEGTTPEEYVEGLTLAKLIHDVVEMLTDEDLLAFLS